jgi:hypothetical protein
MYCLGMYWKLIVLSHMWALSPGFSVKYGVPDAAQDTLGGAKMEVARILRRTGVETLWAATSGESVSRLPSIDINIIPSSMSNRLTLPPGVSKDALGFTPGVDPTGNGLISSTTASKPLR